MIGLRETIAPGAAARTGTLAAAGHAFSIAATCAAQIQAHTPTAGIWLELRDDAPWLRVFPFGWVPVTALLPAPCGLAGGQLGWALDPARCTAQEAADLARLLEQRGVDTFEHVMAIFADGRTVGIGPLLVQRTHDFDHNVSFVLLASGKGGPT